MLLYTYRIHKKGVKMRTEEIRAILFDYGFDVSGFVFEEDIYSITKEELIKKLNKLVSEDHYYKVLFDNDGKVIWENF